MTEDNKKPSLSLLSESKFIPPTVPKISYKSLYIIYNIAIAVLVFFVSLLIVLKTVVIPVATKRAKVKNSKFDTKINEEILYSWLSGNFTVNELKNGYHIKLCYETNFGAVYELSDFPVKVFASPYWSDTYNYSENDLSFCPILAVSAPASILARDYIDNISKPFLKNGIISIPNGTFPNSSMLSLCKNESNKTKKIANDTQIYITKEGLVNISGWEDMTEKVDKKELDEYSNRLSFNTEVVFDLGSTFAELKKNTER